MMKNDDGAILRQWGRNYAISNKRAEMPCIVKFFVRQGKGVKNRKRPFCGIKCARVKYHYSPKEIMECHRARAYFLMQAAHQRVLAPQPDDTIPQPYDCRWQVLAARMNKYFLSYIALRRFLVPQPSETIPQPCGNLGQRRIRIGKVHLTCPAR